MSTRNEEERERLKQEYKDHYRRIKKAKEQLRAVESRQKVSKALHQMNSQELLGEMDEFLGKVRDRVIGVEARLEVALDSLEETPAADQQKTEELDQELKKSKAKETIQQVKLEMGMLYSDLEKQAGSLRATKTIGSGSSSNKE